MGRYESRWPSPRWANAATLCDVPTGADEKLVYTQVLEAYFDGLADQATPAFFEELKGLGIVREKLLPGYSFETWERAVHAAAKLFPHLGPNDAQAEVGRRLALATVNGSTLGKTLLPLLRVMGKARALRRAFGRSAGENYNEVTFGAETPSSLEMHMSDVGGTPDMPRGSVVGIGEAMGFSLRARIVKYEKPRATYLIEW